MCLDPGIFSMTHGIIDIYFWARKMKNRFRYHHLLNLLKEYDHNKGPFDRYMSRYFRDNKAIGSKDRKQIAQSAYDIMRYWILLQKIAPQPKFDQILDTYFEEKHLDSNVISTLDPADSVSFPPFLWNKIHTEYGDKAYEICKVLNERAPLTIRVNRVKIDPNVWIQDYADDLKIKRCSSDPAAIRILENVNLFNRDDFRKGLIEVQDESSQRVADMIRVEPGQLLMDYCAGSGGKSLACAWKMEGQGQIFLHDIRGYILDEAKKRFKRAGIQNYQVCPPRRKKLKTILGKIDWVLVDVPCSGTGTLRRNPDLKLRFKEEDLEQLIAVQRKIVEEALPFLKRNGSIVYATCSILADENENQIAYFEKVLGLKCKQILKILPHSGSGDGFFAACLQRSETSDS